MRMPASKPRGPPPHETRLTPHHEFRPDASLASTPVRRFFRPEDLHELFTFGFEALNVLEHARAHLPPEEYATRWSPSRSSSATCRACSEIAFPSPGQVLTSMEPGHYRTTFNYVAHRQREAAFAVELLSAQSFGGFTHEWLVRFAPATLGPAPWEHLLAEAYRCSAWSPSPKWPPRPTRKTRSSPPRSLLASCAEALDNLGCLASRPSSSRCARSTPPASCARASSSSSAAASRTPPPTAPRPPSPRAS
ncbi:hypothetical protein ACN28S_67430 [Cystobacter fuscus]